MESSTGCWNLVPGNLKSICLTLENYKCEILSTLNEKTNAPGPSNTILDLRQYEGKTHFLQNNIGGL